MEFSSYQKLSLGVDCVIVTSDIHEQENKRMNSSRGLQVLLMKRTIDPFDNCWSLPGGLVEPDKGLEETIDEKLLCKTNINNIYKEQLYTYGDNVNRDPRGRVVSVAYLALANKSDLKDIQSSFYGEVKWFWVELLGDNLVITDSLTGETIKNLAFDHANIIKDAMLRMKNKVMYTNIAFEMLPTKFTMRELQDVYEVILNKSISSFRKLVDYKLIETDEYSEIKAHRPAKLFTLNKEM